MKVFSFLILFSAIFLNRFGLNIVGDFSLSFSYVFVYLGLFLALKKNFLFLNINSCYLFLCVLFSGLISCFYGQDYKSLFSFYLFLFVYFPFVFEKYNKVNADINFLRFYFPCCLVVAFFGIFQFLLQFVFKPDWLFDYRPFIPDFFRNRNPMNTVIPFGSFFKSNGFFLLEPSGFSQLMSFGMYLVCIYNFSIISFFVFFTGLCLSFSGTGIILFFFSSILAFFNSFSLKKYVSFIFLFCFFSAAFLFKDISVLSRIEEFSAGAQLETSSAAARFINPLITLNSALFSSSNAFFFGQGPGTITRVELDYKAHDPVWAKLFFEYGFLGGLLFLIFIFYSVSQERLRSDILFLFFVQWFFLGGHLLSLDTIAVYFVYSKFTGYE